MFSPEKCSRNRLQKFPRLSFPELSVMFGDDLFHLEAGVLFGALTDRVVIMIILGLSLV